MEPKTITIEKITEKYNNIIDKALKFNYLVRDSELQQEQIDILNEFIQEVKYYKAQAIEKQYEYYANMFFHIQCVANSFISILTMWIELKNNNNKNAWNKLIDAQEYLSVAMRVEGNQFGLDDLMQEFQKIETIVFPGWNLYNSSGFVEQGGKCSICSTEYGQCDHLEGLIYMGRLCYIYDTIPLFLDHTAFVKNPKDKRCIIEWISTDDGKKRDYITWKILDEEVESENGGKVVGGVIHNHNILDYD